MLKVLANPFEDPISAIPNLKTNPYVTRLQQADECDQAKTFYGEALKDKTGTWRETLGLSAETPLILEIGCHKGRTLNAMAKDHPELGFLGMDITYKRVVMTAERAKKRNLTNVGVMMCNANHLDKFFAPGELNGVLIFFPDPWPKLKHLKHRLYKETFASQLRSVIRPGGFLWLKTDDESYFQTMLEVSAKLDFEPIERLDLITGRYCTTFEEKFLKEGIPANEVMYRLPL